MKKINIMFKLFWKEFGFNILLTILAAFWIIILASGPVLITDYFFIIYDPLFKTLLCFVWIMFYIFLTGICFFYHFKKEEIEKEYSKAVNKKGEQS